MTDKKTQNLTINASNETLKGHYSNATKVLVADNEVILDFAFVYANTIDDLRGEMVDRVIITPKLAKDLADSILKTIETHSQKRKKNE